MAYTHIKYIYIYIHTNTYLEMHTNKIISKLGFEMGAGVVGTYAWYVQLVGMVS